MKYDPQIDLWIVDEPQLTSILDDAFGRLSSIGFSNPEPDRYFHVSVADNRGGDPLQSFRFLRFDLHAAAKL